MDVRKSNKQFTNFDATFRDEGRFFTYSKNQGQVLGKTEKDCPSHVEHVEDDQCFGKSLKRIGL